MTSIHEIVQKIEAADIMHKKISDSMANLSELARGKDAKEPDAQSFI